MLFSIIKQEIINLFLVCGCLLAGVLGLIIVIYLAIDLRLLWNLLRELIKERYGAKDT